MRRRFLERDGATGRRADETRNQQPQRLLDGCPRMRSETLSRPSTGTPRPVLPHPLIDERLDQRGQVCPRRRSTIPRKLIEVNERL